MKKLSDFCNVYSGYAFKEFNDSKNGNPVLKIGNININGTINLENCQYSNEVVNEKYISQRNDLYIALSGATTGKVGIMNSDEKFYINQRVGIIRCKNNNIPVEYLKHYLISKTNKILSDASGCAQPNISPKMLENYPIKDLEIHQMSEIADRLKKITDLIQKNKTLIKKYDELVKSQFIEMFGTLEDGKFPIKTIEELCVFVKDGTHQTPTYTDDKINGYKFLSSKDVTSGYINWNNIKYIPEDLHNELYSRIKPQRNDILLAKNGTTGIGAIVETDEIFDIYVSLALLRFYSDNNVKYMWCAINMPDTKKQFNESLKGVGVPNLHLGEVKKTKLLVPPIELQNQFADFVKHIDKLKFRETITKLKNLCYNIFNIIQSKNLSEVKK